MKWFLPIIAAALIAACAEEPVLETPHYDSGLYEAAFKPKSSHIPFPLFVSYTELEGLINGALPVVLVNETNFDKGKLKNTKARILRTGPIELSTKSGRLFLRVPLKADVRPRMTKHILGADIKVAPKIKAAFFVNLSTTVDFSSDYQIISDLKVESIDWIDDPTVHVVFWDLPITDVVDSLIADHTTKIESVLNGFVETGVNLKKPITKVWKDLQKPLRINKQVADVFLLNNPYNLKLGEIVLTNKGIIAHLELFTYVKTGLQTDTANRTPTPLPDLEKVDSTDKSFEINFLVNVPLKDASEILNTQFAKQDIEVPATSLRIEDINLYSSPERLILSTALSEPTSSLLHFEGEVSFNPMDTSISAGQFDFLVVEGNSLVKAAEAMLHTSVLSAIGEELSIPLGGLISQIGPLVEGAVETGHIGKSIALGLEDVMLEPTEITLRPDTLLMNVRGSGNVSLQIIDFKPHRRSDAEVN